MSRVTAFLGTWGARIGWIALYSFTVGAIASLIDSHSLPLDEAFSASVSSQDPLGMVQFLVADTVSALYYLLLHGWLHIASGTVGIRALSAVLTLAALPIFGLLALELFDRRIALAATALLVASSEFLWYAVEARSYALTFLGCTAAALFFVRCAKRNRPFDYAAFAISAVAATYAHATAALFVAGLLASWLMFHHVRVATRRLWYALASVVTALLPLVALVTHEGTRSITWTRGVSAPNVALFAAHLFGGPAETPLATLLAAALVGFAAAGYVAAQHHGWRREATIVLTWALVPLALGMLLSMKDPVLVPHHFRFCLIPASLLAGCALGELARRRVFVAAALLVAYTSASLLEVLPLQREDWRSLSVSLARESRPRDGLIVFAPYALIPLEYASREMHVTSSAALIYPSEPVSNGATIEPMSPDLRNTLVAYRRVCIVLAHESSQWPSVIASLTDLYPCSTRRAFGQIELVRFSRAGCPVRSQQKRDAVETQR